LTELPALKACHQIDQWLKTAAIGSLQRIQVLDSIVACYDQRK
jgi:hypothetical protein